MINLLPPQRLANIRIARSNTILRRYIELLLLAFLVIAGALVAANYYMNIQQTNVKTVVDTKQQEIKKLEPVQKQAEQLSGTINTIAGLLSRDVNFSDMLIKIGGLMPQGSVLTGLQFSIEDLKSPLVISAQVDNEAKAAVLLNNLKASGLFKTAEIKSITTLKADESSTSATTTTTALTPTTTTTAPTPVTEVVSPYKYTTVINVYVDPSANGVKL